MRFFVILLFAVMSTAADYRAGVASNDITPADSIWLSGYASRTKPSEGVLHPLSAKALAIQDNKGANVVIVTTDLLGLTRGITDAVGAKIARDLNIPRERVLFNSSHTHTGPVIRANLAVMYDLSPEQDERVREYSRKLTEDLFTVVSIALKDLKPARVSYGSGTAGFAMNRRHRSNDGSMRIGVNAEGPMEHSVPVLRVDDEKGNPRAVLFGYTCHNTTLTGEHYKVSGDYAGFAQAAIEKELPGVTALFLLGCAGDQNPNPRGQESHAVQHGQTLAAEVKRVLAATKPVTGTTGGVLQFPDLPLQTHQRSDFEAMLDAKDPIRVRFAKSILATYDARRPQRSVSFPVQGIRIGKDAVIIALGGEPVVEYALRLKKANPKLRLMVAGYSNDVMGYLPTAKMLEEGGYEPIGSAMYYGLPAPYAPEAERLVHETMDAVLKRVMR